MHTSYFGCSGHHHAKHNAIKSSEHARRRPRSAMCKIAGAHSAPATTARTAVGGAPSPRMTSITFDRPPSRPCMENRQRHCTVITEACRLRAARPSPCMTSIKFDRPFSRPCSIAAS